MAAAGSSRELRAWEALAHQPLHDAKTHPYAPYQHPTARSSVVISRMHTVLKKGASPDALDETYSTQNCWALSSQAPARASLRSPRFASELAKPFLPSTHPITAQVRDQTAAQVRRR